MSRTHPLVRRKTRPPHAKPIPPTPPDPRAQQPRGCRSLWVALLLCLGLGALLGVVLFGVARTQPPSTFVVIGVDQRPEERGPSRSDVIMLLQVAPRRGQVALVSVPRDLWLPQPDGVTNRINTALVAGYDPDDPAAGPDYLAQTLETNFGVPIDGYFLVNFDGFIEIIDAVGGVDVDVPVPIVDPAYPTADYGTQTIRFEAGPQHLDAEQALIYVRTRHQDSDFGRAARQQQVTAALAHKLIQPQSWLRLPAVLLAVAQSVQTDVGLTGWPTLGWAAYFLASGQVETLVLDDTYVTPWTTETGAYVLLPQWEAIRPAFQRLFFAGG